MKIGLDKEWKTYLRRALRRRYVYHRCSLKSDLHPIKISRKELKRQKSYYEELIESLVSEMKQFGQDSQNMIHSDFSGKQKGKQKLEDFQILSYNGDLMGKVFCKDHHIYRGIYGESVESFAKLWNSGLLKVLGDHHFIPKTTVTDFYAEEYPVIIEHEVVDMTSSKMWNFSMIKDACILMCMINQVAQRVGFTLHDGHLNNITFHQGKPIFTDIGSLVENRGQKTSFASGLVFAGLYRLLFTEINNSILKRVQVYDEENNAIWMQPMCYDDTSFEYYHTLKRVKQYHMFHSNWTANQILFRLFDCYDVKPEYIHMFFQERKIRNPREVLENCEVEITKIIDALVDSNICVDTVTDIGGTGGKLPVALYQKFGAKVISLEYSDSLSEKAYQLISDLKVPVNTVLFHYLYGADDHSRNYVQSNVAVALDITHNLITYQRWKVDSLLNSLSKLTKKYVVVTYYPKDEQEKENFEKEFINFFHMTYCSPIEMRSNKGMIYIGEKNH